MSNNDYIELSVCLHAVTDRAYRVSNTGDDDDAVWVPISQCATDHFDYTDIGDEITLEVKEWIAEEKGLI